MGDFEPVIPTYDGEKHMLAAAWHIIKAVESSINLSDDMRKLLADLDSHLSAMTILPETRAGGTREVEEQLEFAQEKVLVWESNQSRIWDSGSEESSKYLQAVYEIQRLTERLRSLHPNRSGRHKKLLEQAHSVLQMAMVRIEEELIHILAQNKLPLEPECMSFSFHSCEEDVVSDESIVSTEEDSIEDVSQRERGGTVPEEHIVDLVLPSAISDIKSIANVMFDLHYGQEFCHSFTCFWKDALDSHFVTLGFNTLSIEDLLKMEWRRLNSNIKKWMCVMKIIVRVYLASQKQLFQRVLGEFGSVSSTCLVETSKGSMLRLLNFGYAIAISPRRPEKLFSLLDMYEVLTDLLQDIESLFSEEVGSLVRTEFNELRKRLGDTARATFLEFGDEVASNKSTKPFPRGGIHPLTKYVMNYINTIAEYAGTLNLLLRAQSGEEIITAAGTQHRLDNSSYIFCPLVHYLLEVTSILESNLDTKSGLYKDGSLKHIFMMNNIHYMVRKVKGSKLEMLYGEDWIKEYTGKFQQHARSYERVTWYPLLSLLMDEGIRKKTIKERYKSFNVAFEEVYKNQTGWTIPEPELRKDLRISTSQKVIQAYRSFTGKNSTAVGDKYVKYTAEDLENSILDLFEGSKTSLQNTRNS